MTDDALPVPEVVALVAELIRTDPTLEAALGGGRPVAGRRLAASPLHPGVEFVRLVVHLPHPGPSYVSARTPSGVVLLRNPDAMVELNRLTGLHLESLDDVAAYLRVWVSIVDPQRGQLIETPEQLRWAPSLLDLPGASEAKDLAAAHVHPVQVDPLGADRFRASATVLERRTLLQRDFEIDADGAVRTVESVVLVDGVPVKATIR